MTPLRTLLLSLSLVLAPLALVPVASAGSYCGEHFCCDVPDPSGNPGSIEYFVTDTYENAVLTTCANADNWDEIVEAARDFVFDCVLGRSC